LCKARFSDGSTGSPKGENCEKEIEKGRIARISLNFENVPSISEFRFLSLYNAVQFLWMKKQGAMYRFFTMQKQNEKSIEELYKW
jgi:hypothetical protein